MVELLLTHRVYNNNFATNHNYIFNLWYFAVFSIQIIKCVFYDVCLYLNVDMLPWIKIERKNKKIQI